MLKYPAIFHPEEGGGFFVEFPDLEGCATEGDTLEEAQAMAKEALDGWLSSVYSRELNIPNPSDIKGDNIYLISVDLTVSLPIIIRSMRKEKGLSQKQIADALNIKYQTYQGYENPSKFNATIKTLKRIFDVFGKELEISTV